MAAEPLRLPVLTGARVTLRAWQPTDADVVREASADPLIPALTTVPPTPGLPEALAFVERQHDRLRTRAGYAFAVADRDDRAVGHIGLFFAGAARASIGSWIVGSERRRGYAADALATLAAWAVRLDGLDRVELYVEPWNTGSWRAAEHAGFHREGLLRAWERVAGVPRDMYMYARLTERAADMSASGAGS